MASDYRFADGHNVALGSLALIVPQPASPGVQVVRRDEAVSGVVHEQGLWIPLNYNKLTVAKYQALNTLFGLASALENDITIYCPNFQYVSTRYNGKIIRPEQGVDIRRTSHLLSDVTYRVINLVAL